MPGKKYLLFTQPWVVCVKLRTCGKKKSSFQNYFNNHLRCIAGGGEGSEGEWGDVGA